MSVNLRNYVNALYGFDHVLKMSSPAAMKRKSPCAGWSGKDVYEHAVGGVKMAHSFATTGLPPRSMVKLGADPLGAWVKLRDATIEALDHEGALARVAKDPFGPDFGPMPVDTLIGFMGADLVVHTWDFARTAKVDERIDPALVKITHAMWKTLPDEALRSPGMIGAAVKSPKGADAQTKMLNFLGRAV